MPKKGRKGFPDRKQHEEIMEVIDRSGRRREIIWTREREGTEESGRSRDEA